MAEGDGGDIWVTVQKVGVYRFDRQGNITAQPKSPYGSGTIYRDKRGGYWICSENALYSYDPYTGGYSKKLRLDGWGLNCMTDDGRGRLWLVCKNSWGTDNPYGGLMFMSLGYFRLNTVAVVMKDSRS